MSNETKRMNYFNGLLLKEEDLTLDQNYHIHHQRLHNGAFHEWGIVEGLDIEEVPKLASIIVKQGLAINKVIDPNTNMMIGQEIWISEEHGKEPIDLSGYEVGENIFISVKYKEDLVDIDSRKGGNVEIHKREIGEINHSNKIPENPQENIIIACVQLKDDSEGNKIVDTESIKYDYIVYENSQKVTIRTYAVTDGNMKEFGQIRIGNKDRINLPHIDGKIENNKDGLEINSPFANFTGKVTSDGLSTTGEAVVNGTLSVNANNKKALQVSSEGNVMIGTNAAVSGTLSATGGMIVTGGSTKIETPEVSFKGNMLNINSNADVIHDNSGVSVYRGKDDNDVLKPQAMLVWDEKESVWKAGTESRDKDSTTGTTETTETTGLYKLLYGSDWEAMKSGAIADTYHKHNVIYDPSGTNKCLEVNLESQVVIPKSVIVTGSVKTGSGIETANKTIEGVDEPVSRLFWNREPTEAAEIGQWQITDNAGKTYDLAYGSDWKDLSKHNNADLLHHHAVMCAKDGNVTLNTNEAGNIEVSNDLTVKKNLIVDGNINIKGEGLQSIKMEQVVTEKTIIVNKPEDGKELAAEGGLEVFRGDGLENAKLIWDEGSKKWKLGTGDVLTELPSGDKWERLTGGGVADNLHSHRALYSEDGVSVISIDRNKNVKIDGNISASNGLSVANDAQIKGALTVDGSVILNGDITVIGKETIIDKEIVKVNNSSILVNQYKSQSTPIENEGGLEVYRGGNVPNARLVWNEIEKLWKIGIGEDLKTFPCGEVWDTLTENYLADGMHKHSILYDTKGYSAISINQNGNVDINNDAYVNGALLVDGALKVNGKLIVDGVTEYVNKNTITTNESIISLNNNTDIITDKGGIEISRGDKPKARFIWDENSKVWKVGIGENLREINPVQLYNDRGDTLALSVRTSGNVDVAHDLLVGQDLTIMGALDVRGPLTRIDSSNIEILSNNITLNRFDEGTLAEYSEDSGITVFRGNQENSPASAALVWSEKELCWKIGLAGAQKSFKVENDGIVNSHTYKVQDTLIIDSEGIFSNIGTGYGIGIVYGSDRWKIGSKSNPGLCVKADGFVGIANSDPKVELDVTGNANINGFMTVQKDVSVTGNINVTGKATVNEDATVKKNVSVEGSASVKSLTIGNNLTFTSNGIEINREYNPDSSNPKAPAKILWDEKTQCWKFGSGESFVELSVTGKDAQNFPSELWTKDKSAVAIETNSTGFVGIGVTPTKNLDVKGDAKVRGNIEVKSLNAEENIISNKVTATAFTSLRFGKEKPAMLQWDESLKKWQAGEEGNLHTIVLGNHTHSELSNETTNIAILEDGQVKVGKNVTVKADGIINAKGVEVTGDITFAETISGKNASITGKTTLGTTTINMLTVNGGLMVHRGVLPKSQIRWVDGQGWQAGTMGVAKTDTTEEIKEDFKNISLEGHTHPELSGVSDISNALKVKNGNIGIGAEADATNKLYVAGDAKVNGKLTATNSDISGTLTVKNITASGNLVFLAGKTTLGTTTINELTVNGGLIVHRGVLPKSQIKWVEGQGWQAGTMGVEKTDTTEEIKEDFKNISLEGHTHSALQSTTDPTKDVLIVTADDEEIDNIEIGSASNKANLDVSGDAKVSGKLTTTNGDISETLTVKNITTSGDLVSNGTTTLGTTTISTLTVSDGIGIKSDGNVYTLKIQSDTKNDTYKLVLDLGEGKTKEIAFV